MQVNLIEIINGDGLKIVAIFIHVFVFVLADKSKLLRAFSLASAIAIAASLAASKVVGMGVCK